MSKQVDETKWNIWLVDEDGTMVSWVGMITDPGTAFSWFRSRDLDPSQFRVNNVPPPTSRASYPLREVYALSATDVREGAPLPVRTFEERGNPRWVGGHPAGKKAAAKKRPAKRPAAKRTLPPDSPEMREMRKSAKELLEQHKADEAAETDEVALHMTATSQDAGGGYFVGCRCGWTDGPHVTRHQARKAGDKHLTEANKG